MKIDPRMDERSVSWKIFVPHGPEMEILLMGTGPGNVKGLGRSFKRLDWLPASPDLAYSDWGKVNAPETVFSDISEIRKKYDIVVCSSDLYLDHMNRFLKEKGMVVIAPSVCGKFSRSGRYHKAFANNQYFASLPYSTPRLIFPLQNKHTALKGLNFHSPGSFRAKLINALLKMIVKSGGKGVLKRNALVISGGISDTSGSTFKVFLSKKLNQEIQDLIIYTGSDRTKRKITALALMADGRQVVVKIADTVAGGESILSEEKGLLTLRENGLSRFSPEILVPSEKWQNYLFHVETHKTLEKTRQIPVLTDAHFSFLEKLSCVGQKKVLLKETPLYQKVVQKLNHPNGKPVSETIRSWFDIVISDKFSERLVISHLVHGDFAPWNIKTDTQSFYVVDWEDCDLSGLALFDLFHFIYRQASLVGPWPGDLRLFADFKQASDRLIQAAKLPEFDRQAVLTMFLLHEYVTNRSPNIEELLDGFLTEVAR